MNTITQYNSAAFQSRHLEIKNPEKFPNKILNAIQDSYAIGEFVHEKPISEVGLLKRVCNFFSGMFGFSKPEKEELLEVSYNSFWTPQKANLPNPDPYERTASVHFQLKEIGAKNEQMPSFDITYAQKGTPRTVQSETYNTTYTHYEAPRIQADDVILKKITCLRDLNKYFVLSSNHT